MKNGTLIIGAVVGIGALIALVLVTRTQTSTPPSNGTNPITPAACPVWS